MDLGFETHLNIHKQQANNITLPLTIHLALVSKRTGI